MQIEDQVVNLELSRRLKEFGVKQESFFYWVLRDSVYDLSLVSTRNCFSAFTVAELGLLIPSYFDEDRCVDGSTNWGKCGADFYAGCDHYIDNTDKPGFLKRVTPEFHAKKEADSRALLLIYLIENNLLKL